MMSLSKTNSWKKVLLDNNLADAGNKNLEAFAKATLQATSKHDRLRALTEDQDTAMLAVAPVTGLLKLCFGMTNLGGTRTDTVNKVVSLDGLDAVATPVVFSMTDIESLIQVQHLTIDTLVAAKTKEDLENAPLVPRRNFLSNSPFVLLPPFITKVLLENVSRDPETLFFLFLDAMKAFDAEHKDDADYAEAILESKNLLIFLWAAFRK